jgi:hypothetical protein
MGDQWPRGWSTRANQAETLNLKQVSNYFTNADFHAAGWRNDGA